MVAIRTETGKCTLDGNVFKIIDFVGVPFNVKLKDCTDEEIPGILKEYFGIE